MKVLSKNTLPPLQRMKIYQHTTCTLRNNFILMNQYRKVSFYLKCYTIKDSGGTLFAICHLEYIWIETNKTLRNWYFFENHFNFLKLKFLLKKCNFSRKVKLIIYLKIKI